LHVPKRPATETPAVTPAPKRSPVEAPKARSTEPPPAPPPTTRPAEPAPPRPAEAAPPAKPAGGPKTVVMRAVQIIEDQDVLYFHAASQIPLDEKPAQKPFVMEEKGIESKGCTFALDRGGIRFYLSRITGRSMNVSKTGVLLLSKQDSLRLRGTHYSILNDLRAHGVLLPFAFGTVAMGKDALYSKIDEALYDLRDALEEILSTKWWNLGVHVLDAKMAQSMASDSPGELSQRDRRMQGTRQPVAGRLDIKTLERLLGKQKKIAEGIHGDLKELAVRSDVDMMVGLNSGSSDDWKPILRASYEVPMSSVSQFNRAVIDMQYRHFQYDLMFVLNGDGEEFSFNEG
jgi:Gas vesicle synthesis protein GvpL/GvpF